MLPLHCSTVWMGAGRLGSGVSQGWPHWGSMSRRRLAEASPLPTSYSSATFTLQSMLVQHEHSRTWGRAVGHTSWPPNSLTLQTTGLELHKPSSTPYRVPVTQTSQLSWQHNQPKNQYHNPIMSCHVLMLHTTQWSGVEQQGSPRGSMRVCGFTPARPLYSNN